MEDEVTSSGHYPEPKGETFPELEEQVLRAWESQDILRKVKERMAGGEALVFCEGPPTANSRPHMGHTFTRAVKDVFLRYHVMGGRKIVPYMAGWDCHGLPVELEVEKELGLRSKDEVEALGVDKFNALCRESVLKYKADWERMSRRIGYWIDYGNAYMTMSNSYIESVWWSVKQLHEKGLLTKDRKVLPYCPRCGTALSAHEVALGFRETEDRSVVVKFRLKGEGASLLAWTATPWALVGNALVAVDKDRDYALYEQGGERYVVASDRGEHLKPGCRLVRTFKGSELVGKEYEPVLGRHEFGDRGYRIVHSSEVMREEGTGIMGISPPHGSVDLEIASAEGVPLWDPLDSSGRFTEGTGALAGKQAREADTDIIRILEEKGLLFKWGVFRHSYPFCWRCHTGLVYKALDSWFVRTTEVKERIIGLNDEIRWAPESFKHGRFGNFLADARDWAVGRDRYWGTPLPVWNCPGGHRVCVGSFDELRRLATDELPVDFDPHRPFIDRVVLRCPECSKEMRREEAVLDCWYDSGCAPFAQYHYPFENIEEFDTHRSVDFIAEGVDQTRGWFYTQLALGTMLFDKPAFMSVLVPGHVLDDKGTKMTRDAGNIVYPEEVFSSIGADGYRMFLMENPVWDSVGFSMAAAREPAVRTLNTLLNVYAFFASNANAYGFSGRHECARTHDLDRWVVSRLHTTIREVKDAFDSLEVHRAVRAIEHYVSDLSGWYVRRSRRRFWEESDPQDRFSAHCTLQECLLELSKLMAPVTPFLADWLYRNLDGPMDSVHLENYPVARDENVNGLLERQMALVMTAVEAGRLARQKADVKLRQPLRESVIAVDSDKAWTLRRFEKMISEELNVRKVTVLESRDKMVQYAAHPNLRTLGPKLKEVAAEVGSLLGRVDQNELVKHLRAKGKVRLGGFDLAEEDVIVSETDKPGYSHACVEEVHVYVELEITQNLKLEGLAREVIRRIQHMRKEQGLRFEDPVDVVFSGDRDVETAISSHKAHIMRETHARSIAKGESDDSRQWTVNKMQLALLVRKA